MPTKPTLTFEDIIRLALENTQGKRWQVGRLRVRCEDKRCPVEAAANTVDGDINLALRTLKAKYELPIVGIAGSLGLTNADFVIEAADEAKSPDRSRLLQLLGLASEPEPLPRSPGAQNTL